MCAHYVHSENFVCYIILNINIRLPFLHRNLRSFRFSFIYSYCPKGHKKGEPQKLSAQLLRLVRCQYIFEKQSVIIQSVL